MRTPESGPRKKLLDAAELLVAENGFDTVSVRDITGAVKANVASINYHFGSRENLMGQIMQRVLAPLCEERLRVLDRLNPQPYEISEDSLSELLSAYIQSLLTTAEKLTMDPLFYLRLVGRVLVLPLEKLPQPLADLREETTREYLNALSHIFRGRAQAKLVAQWSFIDCGLSQSLLTLTSGDSIPTIMQHWLTLANKGLDDSDPFILRDPEPAPKEEPTKEPIKEPDPQGMLFDF